MTDIERVLLVLLPALSLMTGCDKSEAPSSDDGAKAAKTDEPEPPTTAVVTGDDPSENETANDSMANDTAAKGTDREVDPEVDREVDPEVDTDPDPETDTANDSNPDSDPDPKPIATAKQPRPDMRMPACPSNTWCATQAASDKIGDKGKRVMKCAPSVTAGATELGKPGYEGLSTYQASFDQPATQSKRKAGTSDSCCYTWTTPCPGGRPLLDRTGVPVRAQTLSRHDPDGGDHTGAIDDAAAAAQWLEDAAMEHASVASFNRAALELLSVGAPLDLVRRCQSAALDELDHAETCLALAARCGAQASRFGALPLPELRAPDLARLAADTFEEGCVGETIATLAMKRAASNVDDAVVAAQLAGIADDELRHAELAWETVTWAVHTGGAEVLAAVYDRAEGLRPDFGAPLPPVRGPSQTSVTGRLDARAATQVAHDTWRSIIEPLLAQLGAEPAAPTC